MKKVYTIIAALAMFAGSIQAQCTVDANAQTTPGVTPTAANLPCIERSVAYNQTVQGKIQETGDTTITISGFTVNATFRVDSVILDSITGAPAGIVTTWAPAVIYGGGNGCVNFAGTTTEAAGTYPLTAWGTAYLRAQASVAGYNIDTPYVRRGNLNRYSPFGDYSLHVIEQGASCTTGINSLNTELNAALSVYPNPNNGVFQISLNAGGRVNGELRVIDVTGRVVYNENIDVMGLYNTTVNVSQYSKGLYTIQLRTATGFASKNISVE